MIQSWNPESMEIILEASPFIWSRHPERSGLGIQVASGEQQLISSKTQPSNCGVFSI